MMPSARVARVTGINIDHFELPANVERFRQQFEQLELDYFQGANLVEAMFCFQRALALKPLSIRSVNTVLAVHAGCMTLSRNERTEELLLACREAFAVLLEALVFATQTEREVVLLLLEGNPVVRSEHLGDRATDGFAALADKVFGVDELLTQVRRDGLGSHSTVV